MEIKGNIHTYQVCALVGETEEYRLYICKYADSQSQCLLQVAKAVEHNGCLDRNAYLLGILTNYASKIEEEYAVSSPTSSPLNYRLGFPELVESFICLEQGNRRINILAFREVNEVGRMVPLNSITTKDQLRVDLRTSVWIMGKLLKLLVFAHSQGIAISQLTGSNILIEPDQHYVLIFDWSKAQIFPEGISREICQQEISAVAQAVIAVIGGDPITYNIPNDGDEAFDQYTEYLVRLAQGKEGRSIQAHQQFYELVDSLWKREFYAFTTKPLNN